MRLFSFLRFTFYCSLVAGVSYIGIVYALGNASTGYQVTSGQVTDVTLSDASCKRITNNATNRFIPTKTMAEWNSFSGVAVSQGVTIGSCVVNGACNNAIQYACAAGTSVSNVAGSCGGNSTWGCNGLNGGTNTTATACSKANAACPPVNCSYTTTGWDACSASCGGGTQSYYYTITVPASNGGTCPVSNGQVAGTQACNTQGCPVNGSCGGGTYACDSGTSANNVGSCSAGVFEYTWDCIGSNGGSSAPCYSSVNQGCFTSDQLVKTLTGEIEISKLKVGDRIMSYDEINNKFVENTIEKIIIHDGIDYPKNDFNEFPLLQLTTNLNGKESITKVTANHPYFNPTTKSYQLIGEFADGDKIQGIDGIGYIVSEVKLNSEPTVYSLHMKNEPYNYVINRIVVHNKCM